MANAQNQSLEDILKDLPKVDHAQWIAKIKEDLKGKSLKEYDFLLDERLSITPFSALILDEKPILTNNQITWQNGVIFDLAKPDVNALILESLKGGCENILLTNFSNKNSLIKALNEVQLNMVGIHFLSVSNAQCEEIRSSLLDLIHIQKFSEDEIIGSIRLTIPFQQKNQINDEYSNSVQVVKSHFPKFKTSQLTFSKPNELKPNWINQTSEILKNLISTFEGQNEKEFIDHLSDVILSIHLSTNYIREVVRIQAIKIVWQNILLANGLDSQDVCMEAHIESNVVEESMEDFMIAAGLSILAATTASGDRIIITPKCNEDVVQNRLKSRIALNIHHLLKFESQLEKYQNPLKGAYFFEEAIKKAAKMIWEDIQK